jgi:hypothetical protein
MRGNFPEGGCQQIAAANEAYTATVTSRLCDAIPSARQAPFALRRVTISR